MLWLSCLNAVSKKSSLSEAFSWLFRIVFFLTASVLPFDLFPLEVAFLVTHEANAVRFHATLTVEEIAQLQEALMDGYRSEITFTLRVYETRKTVFFGDTLLHEAQHTYTSRWDPIGKEYQLTTSTNDQYYFPSWEGFLHDYTQSPLFKVPASGRYPVYTTCQVVLKPKLFNPPLQILNSVAPLETVTSRWVRMTP